MNTAENMNNTNKLFGSGSRPSGCEKSRKKLYNEVWICLQKTGPTISQSSGNTARQDKLEAVFVAHNV